MEFKDIKEEESTPFFKYSDCPLELPFYSSFAILGNSPAVDFRLGLILGDRTAPPEEFFRVALAEGIRDYATKHNFKYYCYRKNLTQEFLSAEDPERAVKYHARVHFFKDSDKISVEELYSVAIPKKS